MAKSSVEQIEVDKNKIIEELQKDSRQSAHEIAEKIGCSRQKVWNIIKTLEKEKIIWGYSTIIDEEYIGWKTYFALFKQTIPYMAQAKKAVNNILAGNTEKKGIKFVALYYTNGPYDGIQIFGAKSIKEAKKYLGYLMKEYNGVLGKIELLESIFPLVQFLKLNPKIQDFKDYEI